MIFSVCNPDPDRKREKRKMRNKSSGIKIYRTAAGKRQKNQGTFSLFCVQAAATCLVMILWWNAFLSVFPVPFHRGWMYAGTCLWIVISGLAGRRFGWKAACAALAAAGLFLWFYREPLSGLYEWILQMVQSMSVESAGQQPFEDAYSGVAVLCTVPVIELLMAVQRRGRGKVWAALILAAPFFAAAAAGLFQSPLPAWLLIAGEGVYFASAGLGGAGTKGGKKLFAWKHAAASILITAAAAFLFFQAGKILDVQRNEENGFYMQTRSAIRTEVIGRVQDLLDQSSEEKPEENPEENMEEAFPEEDGYIPEQETAEDDISEDSPDTDFSGRMGESGMDDLGSLAYFRPRQGQVSYIEVDEKPEKTVYVPLRWGVSYSDNSWTKEDVTSSTLAPSEEYRKYPDELENMLETLCGDWKNASFSEVSRGISSELSERAVYDTEPGATPEGRDFVEYFLMENHKGFCVHFATAAVLMYRYCGYTARYAEGYAVPAASFRENDSGGYEAQITAEMGHAWCQVYDGQTEEWTDMEHTPPAPEGADIQPPASDSVREGTAAEKAGAMPVWLRRLKVWSAAAAGIIASGAILFFGQAAVRTARRRRKFFGKDRGRAICEMYAGIIKTAQFQGAEIKDPLLEDAPARLEAVYPELSREEWEWMYRCVMENMFYHPRRGKESREKMRSLYIRFRKAAYSRMKPAEKWRFRYILCL